MIRFELTTIPDDLARHAFATQGSARNHCKMLHAPFYFYILTITRTLTLQGLQTYLVSIVSSAPQFGHLK